MPQVHPRVEEFLYGSHNKDLNTMVHNIQVGSGKEDNNYYNSQMLHKLQAEMSFPDGRSDWHKVPVSNIYIFDAMWINNCGSSTLQLMVKKKFWKTAARSHYPSFDQLGPGRENKWFYGPLWSFASQQLHGNSTKLASTSTYYIDQLRTNHCKVNIHFSGPSVNLLNNLSRWKFKKWFFAFI